MFRLDRSLRLLDCDVSRLITSSLTTLSLQLRNNDINIPGKGEATFQEIYCNYIILREKYLQTIFASFTLLY